MISQLLWRFCVETKTVGGTVEYIIPEHILNMLLKATSKSIEYDESWYLKRYDDIAEAVRSGVFRDGHDHYINFGFIEDRQPRHISVDEVFYRDRYPDVDEAIDSGDLLSGQAHFDQVGFLEGRLPYEGFKLF